MTVSQVPPRRPYLRTAAVAALLGLSLVPVEGATFTWKSGTTGAWKTAASWNPAGAPTGTDPTDILTFGGDTATTYISTDDFAGAFLLNQLVFTATDTTNKQNSHLLTYSAANNPLGSVLQFSGDAPKILQNGAGNFTIKLPITSTSDLIFGGTGASNTTFTTSVVTLDGGISGVFNITKEGANTFRFGSTGPGTLTTGTGSGDFIPSANRWIGNLTVNDGAIRFNNNAYTAPTALRSNPVTLNGDSVLSTQFKKNLTVGSTSITPGADPDSSLRLGTLSGAKDALVLARREDATSATTFDSVDIVITALSSGTFAGTLRNKAGAGEIADSNNGKLVVRGIGQQTFSGTLDLSGDVEVGRGATLTLAGTASLSAQTSGAIVLKGGTFRLDNTTDNSTSRLRDATSASTGLESIGGGTFSLIGNAAGTVELLGRLQLGNDTNPRSGALTINVTKQPNSTGATEIRFQSLSRDSLAPQFSTLHFVATDSSGVILDLGQSGNNARVTFATALATGNGGLIRNTGNAATADSIGWATVSRAAAGGALDMDFATYGATNGIAAVTTQLGFAGSNSQTNVRLNSSTSLDTAANPSVASLKLAPTEAGQVLTLSGNGVFNTNGFLLAGNTDFTISGPAAIAGTGARYFHVQNAVLTVNAPVTGSAQPIVKAGAGTLVLTSAANSGSAQPTVINEGVLRATPGSSLPNGDVRFRGGVLELQGNGTTVTEFTRQIGSGANKVTWSGLTTSNVTIGQDRGSGGFAAIGSDANVTITGISGGTTLAWEDPGFVDSGHALIFGSATADRVVNWTNNIKLTSNDSIYPTTSNGQFGTIAANYNAREIRVIDNPSVSTDRARIGGTVSGAGLDDLFKTGTGTLELSGTNTYQGATLVQEGTLVVNGSIEASFMTQVANGATLAGGGTVGAVHVASGGTLAPGELAGLAGQIDDLAIKSGLTFGAASAKFKFELGGGSNDQLNVSGGVTLNGAELVGSLLDGFLGNPGDLFFLIINDGTDAVQGTFAQGSKISFGGLDFEIGYFGDSVSQQFTGGNDVVLRVIPEPSSTLLLGTGIALLGARRRKRA